MAKLDEYTVKQQAVMNQLAARATRYKMKIDEINRALAQPVISFEDNQALRERLKMFRDLFKKASDEITEVTKQRDIYKEHLEAARKHIEMASELNKKWGFEKDGK